MERNEGERSRSSRSERGEWRENSGAEREREKILRVGSDESTRD